MAGKLIAMRSAQVSELKERLDEVLEAVRNGETVEIREGERAIGQLVPKSSPAHSARTTPDQTALEAHIDELLRQGKAHRGTGTLPDWFFTQRPPKFEGGSVLEQLLHDREEGW
jgi:antitoxin (DNA-binding transcriptional repressor) of toxin-antitoxin stability system